jgi:ABC-type uncharacterized transport system YnjBCD ATPase subunit
MPSRENLAHIGYMTQSDGIYPELSVWENLTFFAALYGQTDKAEAARDRSRSSSWTRGPGRRPRTSPAGCGAACRWPAPWPTTRR